MLRLKMYLIYIKIIFLSLKKMIVLKGDYFSLFIKKIILKLILLLLEGLYEFVLY